MSGISRVLDEGERKFLSRYHPEQYAPISITVDAIVVGVAKDTTDNYRKLDRQSLNILLVKREQYSYAKIPAGTDRKFFVSSLSLLSQHNR